MSDTKSPFLDKVSVDFCPKSTSPLNVCSTDSMKISMSFIDCFEEGNLWITCQIYVLATFSNKFH